MYELLTIFFNIKVVFHLKSDGIVENVRFLDPRDSDKIAKKCHQDFC